MARGTYEIDKDKVKKLALEKGLSINKFCESVGISQTVFTVNKSHYPATIKRIADALGVSIAEIIKE